MTIRTKESDDCVRSPWITSSNINTSIPVVNSLVFMLLAILGSHIQRSVHVSFKFI